MEQPDQLRALAVIRVSSNEQARKGMSMESQEEWKKKIEVEMNIEVVEVIKEVISGEVFPVEYFDYILKVADEKKINCIIVYAIDRFARNYSYGSILLQKLHEKRNIKIITSLRTYDLNNREDRFWVGLLLVLAEREQGNRLERTFRGMVTKLKKGMWPLSPPFGYEKIDNQLRLLPEYKPVIHFIFDIFIQIKNYAETARIVNEKFGKEMDFELTSNKIKKIVQDRTYLGFLRWNNILFGEGDGNKSREELKAIDSETFEKAQVIVKQISRRYSKASSSPVERLVEEYGIEAVNEASKRYLKISCPKCGSVELQKNGNEEMNGSLQSKYICKRCGHHFRFPSEKQLKKIENLVSLPCRKCGLRDQFILEKDISGFWKLICKECGYIIFLQEYCDKHRAGGDSNNPENMEKKVGSSSLGKDRDESEKIRNQMRLDSLIFI